MALIGATITIFPKLYQDKGSLIQSILMELEKELQVKRITISSGDNRYVLIVRSRDDEVALVKFSVQEGGYELNLELSILASEKLATKFIGALLDSLSEKANISFFEIRS